MFWFSSSLPKVIRDNSSVADIYRKDVTVRTPQNELREDKLVVLDTDYDSFFFLESSSRHGSFANVFQGLDSRGHRRGIRILNLPSHPEGSAIIGHPTEKSDVLEIAQEVLAEEAVATQVSSFAMFHDKQEHNLFFVMPYAQASGKDVFSRVSIRCLELPDDIGLMLRASIGKTLILDIARDINRLAGLNLAHNDIKPDNFLWHRHSFHLADFGGVTRTDAMRINLSTPTYRAPEFLSNDHRKPRQNHPTETSDIFCLGISGCEMVTGTRLFIFDAISDNFNDLLVMNEFRKFRTGAECSPEYRAHFQFVWARLFVADPILGKNIADMLSIEPINRPNALTLIGNLTLAPPIGNATGQQNVDTLLDALPLRNDDLGFSEVYQTARAHCEDITKKHRVKPPLTMAVREIV